MHAIMMQKVPVQESWSCISCMKVTSYHEFASSALPADTRPAFSALQRSCAAKNLDRIAHTDFWHEPPSETFETENKVEGHTGNRKCCSQITPLFSRLFSKVDLSACLQSPLA